MNACLLALKNKKENEKQKIGLQYSSQDLQIPKVLVVFKNLHFLNDRGIWKPEWQDPTKRQDSKWKVVTAE